MVAPPSIPPAVQRFARTDCSPVPSRTSPLLLLPPPTPLPSHQPRASCPTAKPITTTSTSPLPPVDNQTTNFSTLARSHEFFDGHPRLRFIVVVSKRRLQTTQSASPPHLHKAHHPAF